LFHDPEFSLLPSSEAELYDRVGSYLTSRSESPSIVNQSIEIYHPRIVQKSYKAEKRLFAPPPFVVFQGDRWLGNPNGAVNAFVNLGDSEVHQV
jgi:hypothetical protein